MIVNVRTDGTQVGLTSEGLRATSLDRLLIWIVVNDGECEREIIWRSRFPRDWYRWQELVTRGKVGAKVSHAEWPY